MLPRTLKSAAWISDRRKALQTYFAWRLGFGFRVVPWNHWLSKIRNRDQLIKEPIHTNEPWKILFLPLLWLYRWCSEPSPQHPWRESRSKSKSMGRKRSQSFSFPNTSCWCRAATIARKLPKQHKGRGTRSQRCRFGELPQPHREAQESCHLCQRWPSRSSLYTLTLENVIEFKYFKLNFNQSLTSKEKQEHHVSQLAAFHINDAMSR